MKRTVFRTASLAALAAGTVIALAADASAEAYRWMAGSPGGTFYTVGGALKGIIEKEMKNVTLEIMHGGGLANIRGIQEEKAVLGFANSVTTVDALAGAAPFNKPHDKVCNITSLFPQYFHIVTLADYTDINTAKDLKGKAVASQVRGTTGEGLLAGVLKANGLKYEDLSKLHQVGFDDAVNLMKDGHAKVFTLANTIPSGALMDLATARTIKMVPMDKATFDALKKDMPGLLFSAIPGKTYPKVDVDVPALTFQAHIAVSCDAPDALVEAVAKAVADNVKELTSVADSITGLTVEKMAMDIGVPFHKAAKKFFADRGVAVK
jgi:TRAP transporter TAXI family solute receptor